MTATIKDIAQKVGVNPSTVSRVINGTASISEETKEKIHAAMKELDYHPNSQARSLVNGSTFTIGLVMDASNSDAYSNTFFINSVNAIEKITQEYGYNLLIASSVNTGNKNAIRDLVLEHKIDGIILPVSSASAELGNLLLNNHFPFVLMGEPDTEFQNAPWVDMDNEQGGRIAVRHLLEKGYKHPIMVVESKGTVFEKKRICGFVKELEANNRPFYKKDIVENCVDDVEIYTYIPRLLERDQSIDGIICSNNVVAYYVLQALKKMKIQIPEQIGVMTFDNYPLAEYLDPPLTVVDVNTHLLGERAASVLFEMIRKKGEKKNTLIKTQIIERKSTKRGGE